MSVLNIIWLLYFIISQTEVLFGNFTAILYSLKTGLLTIYSAVLILEIDTKTFQDYLLRYSRPSKRQQVEVVQ